MLKIKKTTNTKSIDRIFLYGDSNISILSLLLASICDNIFTIDNISNSYEVDNLIDILKQFGIDINKCDNSIILKGKNIKNWSQVKQVINVDSSVETLNYLVNIISKINFRVFITGNDNLLKLDLSHLKYLISKNNIEFRDKFMLPLLSNGTSTFQEKKVNVYNTIDKNSIILNTITNNQECLVFENDLKEEYLENLIKYLGFNIKEILSEKKDLFNKHSKKQKEIYISKTIEKIKDKKIFIPISIKESVYAIFIAYLLNLDSFVIENVSLNELNSDIIKILIDNGIDIQYKNQKIINGIKVVDFYIKNDNMLKEISISRKRIMNIDDMYQLVVMLNVIKKNKITITGLNEIKDKKDYNNFVNVLKEINVKITEYKDIVEIDPYNINIKNKEFNLSDSDFSSNLQLILFLSNIAFSKDIFKINSIDKELLKIFPNFYNILEQLNLYIENED